MSEQPVGAIRSAPIIRPSAPTDASQQQNVFPAPTMQLVQGGPRPNMNVVVVRHDSAAPGYVLVPHTNMPQPTTTIIRQGVNMMGGQPIFVRAQAPLNTPPTTSTYIVQPAVSNAGGEQQLNGALTLSGSTSVENSGISTSTVASAASRPLPTVSVAAPAAPRAAGSAPNQELISKCNQFFNTLLQLASQQSKTTHEAVRNLAQSLIDGKINAQVFTARLQEQLNSTPQPNLVPFLDKTLPSFRTQMSLGNMMVDGIRPPQIATSSTTTETTKPAAVESHNGASGDEVKSHDKLSDTLSSVISDVAAAPSDGARTPSPAANRSRPSRPPPSSNRKPPARSTASAKTPAGPAAAPSTAPAIDRRPPVPDDDEPDEETLDNLMEEKQAAGANSALTFTARSFRDDAALNINSLKRRVQDFATRAGLDGVTEPALQLLANATQQRLRKVLEQLAVVTEHRLELYARDTRFEPLPAGDPKASFKTLEDADRLEQLRYAKEQEQSLLRHIKSRTKNDDPDQAKLKQKAKELVQAQQEEKKQQAANLTALAAIAGRKSRKFDDVAASTAPPPPPAALAVDSPSSAPSIAIIRQPANTATPAATAPTQSSATLTRLKRATMKDLLFVLEQSPDYAHSKLLYRLALK